MSYIDHKVYILGGILHIREPNKFANQLKNIFLFKIKFIYLNPKPIIMNLKHIKSDVYQFIAGDYLNVFLTEKELRTLIKDNDIAFVYKTPIGWFVDHDKGQLPFHHYLQMMSEGALDSLSIILQNNIYEHE